MKNNWQIKKLGELTENLDSKRVPVDAGERNKRIGNIPYYGANGQIGWIDDYLFDEPLLLVAEDGGNWGPFENSSYIIAGKSWVNNHAHVLRCGDVFTLRYLNYYLSFKDLKKYISGTTRGKLNQKALNSIDILLPSEEIKAKIVERLDAIRKLQELNSKEIEKAEELFDSYLIKQFAQNKRLITKKIGEVTESIPYGLSTSVAGNLDENGTPILTMAEVNDDGSISYLRIRKIKVGEKERNKFLLKRGDVLFNWRNASKKLIGKTVIFESDLPTIYASFLLKVVPKKELSNYYLAYYLNFLRKSNYFSNYCKEQANNTVNASELKAIDISYPPLVEQKRIVNELFSIQKYKGLLLEQRNSIKNLFESKLNNLMRPN